MNPSAYNICLNTTPNCQNTAQMSPILRIHSARIFNKLPEYQTNCHNTDDRPDGVTEYSDDVLDVDVDTLIAIMSYLLP